MPSSTDVAIIGAGPYGLSLAAFLAARGIDHTVIGRPMAGWSTGMPKGMQLKSEGYASNLFDPREHLTLERYCAARDIPYAELGRPVDLDTFIAYGLDFQRKHVPGVEDDRVVSLDRAPEGFTLRLAGGQVLQSRRVVLATGIAPFRHSPEEFVGLPSSLASHASDHHDLSEFRGRDVTVIGGGSSAVDLAALLHEAGAAVRLIARRDSLYIHSRSPLPRPWRDRIRNPMSGIGPSWRSLFFTQAPFLFRRLSEERRLRLVRTHLGPAAGWFMADRVAPVPKLLGHKIDRASLTGDRVRLDLVATDGSSRAVTTDHVIAATGYRIDVQRYDFMSNALRTALATVQQTPILSPSFESSIPDLFIIGPAAANSFGPVMRFAVGAGFTARRLARRLAGERHPVAAPMTDPSAALAEAGG